MTSATIVPPDVDEYLAAVRRALADLPPAEQDDLVAEVEASLAEAAADTDTPLGARLGAPDEFAAELRSAAGLHDAQGSGRVPVDLRRLVRELGAHRWVQPVRRTGRELAPLWWAARGVVAVLVLSHLLDAGWATRYPLIPSESLRLGLALIALGAAVSVWLGLWARRRGPGVRRAAVGLDVALALAAIPVAGAVMQATSTVPFSAVPTPVVIPPGLVYDGQPIRNVYPFSRDGRLLHDVLLYDDAGRPLEIAGNRGLDPDRRVVVTNGNRPLWNAFPIRYYEPGTRRVARPNARPYIELPLILTPPLEARKQRR